MIRRSIKIVGAQGQGVNSVGEMVAKGLKRAGYCVFGYREYMSLIKGGHSSYQLDVSPEEIRGSETAVDVVVTFNHHGIEKNLRDLKEGGILVHQTGDWEWSKDDAAFLQKRGITVLYLPADDILAKIKAKPILGNVLITSVVWHLLGRNMDDLRREVRAQFEHKGEEVVRQNLECVDAGVAFCAESAGKLAVKLPPADPARWKDALLVTGSQAMGLGLVHAGCRFYAGYPMTPSSPLLTFIADNQNETGMVVKQAEDEITAAQMASGASFMGARAATATSGGGFDLMTETVSLNAIIENPMVFILAQRPGPGTGLPTWTAQGDLSMAVHSAHGEFPRLVLSVSDAGDSFRLMADAFDHAERFQLPVVVLTDKQCAEALFTHPAFDQSSTPFDRGNLVTDASALAKLSSADRYDPRAKDGVSARWLPGAPAATYAAQGDEHAPDGTVDETAENARAQMEKRMRKGEALKAALPEPTVYACEKGRVSVDAKPGKKTYDLALVTWGSAKGPVLDALSDAAFSGLRVAVVHYAFLWPLKTDLLARVLASSKRAACVEANYGGQLKKLLRAEGIDVSELVHKYDGRPFFVDELIAAFRSLAA
jgi:2-oxoglutarate ferredoxin oxidoreductase subunit alpha